nr:ribonuclease H-like domain-containing protein [Tanacetum cinerariifolium]
YDHNLFQAISDESSDHKPFQVTSDKSSDHNPIEDTSNDTLKSSYVGIKRLHDDIRFTAAQDVMESENSFVLVTQTATAEGGAITTTISSPVTADEKIKKKNDVKARSMLLMALPNEHLMTFNQYKDAKSLFAAIEIRFGGNEATKKNQKTLLKQMYENFSATSTESLDSIFNRLQKINKHDLDTMSIDDLYNNFKIVK